MAKRSDAQYLGDIVDYGREALAMIRGLSREEFLGNRILQLATAHLVMIVGEASYNLSDETRRQIPAVRWPDVIGMRHRLVHDYGNISVEIVWDTATGDLEPLVAAVEQFVPEK